MIVFHLLLTALMLLVIWQDVTSFTIRNWLNALVLVLYPVMLVVTPSSVDIPHALMVFGGTFVVMALLFGAGFIGGGDAKLIMALSLWVGSKMIIGFVMYMAFIGGALAIAILMLRPGIIYAFGRMGKLEKLPRIFNYHESARKVPLPYGVAIAFSFLILLWAGDIPGLPR